MNTKFFALLFGTCVSLTVTVTAAELVPVAAWTDGEVHSADYSVQKMIDGNPNSYVCFLDDTRTGTRQNTAPPNADFPITAKFVLDLGSVQKTVGIRFVTRNDWMTVGPENVSVFVCDDPQGKTNVRWIRENAEVLPVNRGYSSSVLWEPVEARYIGVRVNETYQIRTRLYGMRPSRENPRWPETNFNTQIAEVRVLTALPDDAGVWNPPDVAFPKGRLHVDWMLQDHGLKIDECFTLKDNAEVEKAMLDKVLPRLGEAGKPFRERMEALLKEKASGSDPRWKTLYLDACEKRRSLRLDYLRTKTDRIVYAKHFVMGGVQGLTGTARVSDEQALDRTTECRKGSQLCLLTFEKDGLFRHEVLIDKPDGVIRDPNISFDGKTIVFAMRHHWENDDYCLYLMDMTDRSIKQITFTPEVDGKKYPCADYEPCFTPEGKIIFSSTRHVQINVCWPNANTNLFTCNVDGSNIQRLTYDELDVNYPQVMEDGRICFTRWEYNDRNAFYLHPIMTMNPDGTAQTEYVGNNSMYPSSYIQSRPIPGSNKLVSIIGGHHVPHKGKLALIDRNRGTQNGANIEYVAGASPDRTPGRQQSTITTKGVYDWGIDFFGQDGPQYQYPFPFDEEHYLVSFCPEGFCSESKIQNNMHGPYNPPMGIYLMTADGERELLAFDWYVSSACPIAVAPRKMPPIKPNQVDPRNNFGTFIVQDVSIGPGLQGLPRGTAKRLRVVALEYRAAKIGKGTNPGEVNEGGLHQTPISFHSGSWDVKHVLGEVDLEEDGSVAFQVPARTPVYFQLLDEKGYCIQSMRSWATLQGGETFACLGCHENKLETTIMPINRPTVRALRKAPQKLRPIGDRPHPLMVRLETESCLDSIENYWGINAPPLSTDPNAPVTGFSYTREIQPILDRHCVSCHHTNDIPVTESDRPISTLSLTGTVRTVDNLKLSPDDDYKRMFTESYLALTNNGRVGDGRYVRWLEVRSRSEMLPPYHAGSSKSPLMAYLEPSHYNVQVDDWEKRTIACWIDLLVPFCGSYTQANTWSAKEKREYLYFLEKRRHFATEELRTVKQTLQ